MNWPFRSPIRSLKLRYKVGLFFVFPIIFTVLIVLGFNYYRERQLIRSHLKETAFQIGQMALGGLHHAFLSNDSAMENTILRGIAQNEIERIWIVDLNAIVRHSSDLADVGRPLNQTDHGCVECHQYSPSTRPQYVFLDQQANTMRVSMPIPNDPECQQCHSAALAHLGVLLVDTSMAKAELQLNQDIFYLSVISTILVSILVLLSFGLIQGLVVRRVEVIHEALTRFGAQDFSVRIPPQWHIEDEITQLAQLFNRVAAEFERLQAERQEREMVRAQAIVEERERIARELHDGVAQFLGYLSAKIGAARLAAKGNKPVLLDQQLSQIEEAIRSQSNEVRSAIIGLKMATTAPGRQFATSVHEFVQQCNRLGELQVRVETIGDLSTFNPGSEALLQLFRILQEAISNVRKHSGAKEALVRLEKRPGEFVMTISDDGVGFDPLLAGLERGGHFGLQIMVERAQAIGALIEIKSAPQQGTQITVTLKNGD